MTRSDYARFLRLAIEYDERRDKLGSSLRELLAPESDSMCVSFGEPLLGGFLDLLEAAVGDDSYSRASEFGSWTRWYFWGIKPKIARIGRKEYKVTTPEDLYDLIQAWRALQLEPNGITEERWEEAPEGRGERQEDAGQDEKGEPREQAHPDHGRGGHHHDRGSVGPHHGEDDGYRPF